MNFKTTHLLILSNQITHLIQVDSTEKMIAYKSLRDNYPWTTVNQDDFVTLDGLSKKYRYEIVKVDGLLELAYD